MAGFDGAQAFPIDIDGKALNIGIVVGQFNQEIGEAMLDACYKELLRLGVVEAVVAPEDLVPTAMGIAGEIAAKPPEAIVKARHTLGTVEEMSLRDGLRFEQSMAAALGA